jgi:hypothetical protein
MLNSFANKWSQLWFFIAAGISLFCLTVTFYSSELLKSPGIIHQLVRFNLAVENNFGALWSGMLLLLVSIHASDGYFSSRNKHPSAANGWATLSVILLLLSLDEIGSFHERANLFLRMGTWLSLLPFAIILLGALTYGLLTLWRVPEQRRNVFWIIAAFSILASVALQEYLEHHSQWWGQYHSLRTVIEEGSELLGSLILLKVSMGNTFGIFKPEKKSSQPVFQALSSFRHYLLIIGVLSAPILSCITVLLPEGGHPADWLTATGFFCAGLVIARRFFESGRYSGLSLLILSITCLVMSAATVLPFKKLFVLYPASLLLFVVWVLRANKSKLLYGLSATVLIVMTFLSLFETPLFFHYLLCSMVSLLTYYVNATLDLASSRAPSIADNKDCGAFVCVAKSVT